jgi:ribokinase
MNQPGIVVLGSLNMDFVVQVERLPAPGETTLGHGFRMIPGGKGANQACAAGKLARSARVCMIGRVGADPFADHLKASLAAAGVDVTSVMGTRDTPTGVALIWVERSGQNSIVVAAGANGRVTESDIASWHNHWSDARCALFQLETPLPAVQAAMQAARSHGALTILDPAPAQAEAAQLLPFADIVTPNETEACILLGRPPARVEAAQAAEMARALRQLGARAVVLKLGDQGCYYQDGQVSLVSEGFRVEAVDTTAAGDTFNAGLAVALAEGMGMSEALRFANAAAAISVTRPGAQASAPSREETDALAGAQR